MAESLALLASGTGRTIANLFACIDRGELEAEAGIVITDRPGIRSLELAEERGVATAVVRPKDFGGPSAFSEAVFARIEAAGCSTVVLAGFLRFLPIPDRWLGRVINIHPSLLPRHGGKGCYGDRVHAAVLAEGDAETGCTVHYVDNVYDHGPAILQRRVAVAPADDVTSLARRVFEQECLALPEALRQHLSGAVRFQGGEAVRTSAD
ncbi:MAG: phosphoribosylglycinamide formyltransferase [Planctomycetota bacterium]|jgi:phosphoribosylglycinamide formyltransferase-1